MNYVEYKIGKSRLIILEGDITKQVTYAIVNAADNELSVGGGVSGAIHKVAGPKLFDECYILNGCKTGEAKLTKGYNLPAKYVIHTVGPVYSGKPKDKENLAKSYQSCLEIASKNNLKSISFPSISTGIYGYPVKEASAAAITTIIEYLLKHEEIERVRMVLYSEGDYKIYRDTTRAILKKHGLSID
jgi:O-acetyl-ADP-ribose deacetylase